jgi:4-diphosphocytidyl-2C-methyl-D-erythritol kinase
MLIAESFGTDVSACLLDKLIFVEGIGNKINILNKKQGYSIVIRKKASNKSSNKSN